MCTLSRMASFRGLAQYVLDSPFSVALHVSLLELGVHWRDFEYLVPTGFFGKVFLFHSSFCTLSTAPLRFCWDGLCVMSVTR